MPNLKISELNAITGLTADDLMVVVDDPLGAPTTKKITFANVISSIVNLNTVNGFIPIGGVIPVLRTMTGCPAPSTSNGWAICDGTTIASQGITGSILTSTQTTPNLNGGAFIRGNATSWSVATANPLGSTGGADTHTHTSAAHTHTVASHTHTSAAHTHTIASHTHTGPSHTHTGPSHTHTISFTSGAGSSHTHGSGSLAFRVGTILNSSGRDFFLMYSDVNGSTVSIMKSDDGYAGSAGYNAWQYSSTGSSLGAHDLYTYAGTGSGSTASESSHTHAVSGTSAASGTGTTGASGTAATGGTSLTSDSTTPGTTGETSLTTASTTPADTGSSSTLPIYFSAVYYLRCK